MGLTNDMSDGAGAGTAPQQGVADAVQSQIVPDFLQPRGVWNYLSLQPQPPAYSSFYNAPSAASNGAKRLSQGSGRGEGLSLIKGEDLVLKPGVPVLESNPTARPWGNSRQASPAPVGNTAGSGDASGGSDAITEYADLSTGDQQVTAGSPAPQTGARTTPDQQGASTPAATGGTGGNQNTPASPAGTGAADVSNPGPSTGTGTQPSNGNNGQASGSDEDQWPEGVPELKDDYDQSSVSWVDSQDNEYEYRQANQADLDTNNKRKNPVPGMQVNSWYLFVKPHGETEQRVSREIGGVWGDADHQSGADLLSAWDEAGLDKAPREPQPQLPPQTLPAQANPPPPVGQTTEPPAQNPDVDPNELARLLDTMSRQEEGIRAAKAGQRAYRYDDQNGVSFQPGQMLRGMIQAQRDGLVDKQWVHDNARKAAELDQMWQDREELIAKAGGWSRVKAMLHGAGAGAAFLAAAPAGAGLGAFGGPLDWLTVPLGAMTTGTLGAYAYNKLMKKLGEYNDAIGSLDASSEIHPMYDAAGELVAFGAGLPKAGMRIAGRALETAAKATEEAEVVSKTLQKMANMYGESGGGLVQGIGNLSKQAALQIAGGATRQKVAQTILNDILLRAGTATLVDTVLKQAGKGLGWSKGQTWGGAGHAALLGMLTMGHGLSFEDYNPEQVGDIILRAQARETLQVPAGTELTEADLAALAKAKGLDAGAISGNVSAPLTPKEVEVYRKVQEAINTGQIKVDVNGVLANARQVLAAGRPKGITAVKVEPAEKGGGVQDLLKKPAEGANASSNSNDIQINPGPRQLPDPAIVNEVYKTKPTFSTLGTTEVDNRIYDPSLPEEQREAVKLLLEGGKNIFKGFKIEMSNARNDPAWAPMNPRNIGSDELTKWEDFLTIRINPEKLAARFSGKNKEFIKADAGRVFIEEATHLKSYEIVAQQLYGYLKRMPTAKELATAYDGRMDSIWDEMTPAQKQSVMGVYGDQSPRNLAAEYVRMLVQGMRKQANPYASHEGITEQAPFDYRQIPDSALDLVGRIVGYIKELITSDPGLKAQYDMERINALLNEVENRKPKQNARP